MCFNILLLSSLLSKNVHDEEGVKVRATNYNNEEEIVLFFHIDTPKTRKDLGITGEACDLMAIYLSKSRYSVCFIELKGSDIGHAVNQITNAYRIIKQKLSDTIQPNTSSRSNFHKIKWKACIRYSGSTPQDIKKYKNQLEKTFDKWEIESYRPLGRRDSNEDITSFIKT